MPTLVKQRTNTDCGVAAVATLLEETYERVWDRLPEDLQGVVLERGMTDEDMDRVLACMGFVKDKHWTRRTYSPYWGTVGATKNLLWGRSAIITAWSRNEEGLGHYVVFDGTEGTEIVLDPSTRDTYTDWKDVEPKQMILFSQEALRYYYLFCEAPK
jgi:hypothetical protein